MRKESDIFKLYHITYVWISMVGSIADFTITASTADPLEISGYIGYGDNAVEIEPEHYDPPLALFGLFYSTGTAQDCLIQY